MATDAERLSRFYQGWDRYQDLLVEVVGNLTDEQLALQADPALRPVWTLAAHHQRACRLVSSGDG